MWPFPGAAIFALVAGQVSFYKCKAPSGRFSVGGVLRDHPCGTKPLSGIAPVTGTAKVLFACDKLGAVLCDSDGDGASLPTNCMELGKLSCPEYVFGLTFSPDMSAVYAACWKQAVRCDWDTTSATPAANCAMVNGAVCQSSSFNYGVLVPQSQPDSLLISCASTSNGLDAGVWNCPLKAAGSGEMRSGATCTHYTTRPCDGGRYRGLSLDSVGRMVFGCGSKSTRYCNWDGRSSAGASSCSGVLGTDPFTTIGEVTELASGRTGVAGWNDGYTICGDARPTQSPRPPTSAPVPPTLSPSAAPSVSPTRPPARPTAGPTGAPSPAPTRDPTAVPSSSPSGSPTTAPHLPPTSSPIIPTDNPTISPTRATARPSAAPTIPPVSPTESPSFTPTGPPSGNPTPGPTGVPSGPPSPAPTERPSELPSSSPTSAPSAAPALPPTLSPSATPSKAPSGRPTAPPSFPPSATPKPPTSHPSHLPSGAPEAPTPGPSFAPSGHPTRPPSRQPSAAPTERPSESPVNPPSAAPSFVPTELPSGSPTVSPPSFVPTRRPSGPPTRPPTSPPSVSPNPVPSLRPSTGPSRSPVQLPTRPPTSAPAEIRSLGPSLSPSGPPSGTPSPLPTAPPTVHPEEGVVTATIVLRPPPPPPVREVVQPGGTVDQVVTGLAVASTSGGAAGPLVMAMDTGCAELGMMQNLSLVLHPTGIEVGGNIYLGCLCGNTIIVLGAAVLSFTALHLVKSMDSDGDGTLSSSDIGRSKLKYLPAPVLGMVEGFDLGAVIRHPNNILLVALFLFQGTSFCALRLLAGPQGSGRVQSQTWMRFIGGTVGLALLLLPLTLRRVVLRGVGAFVRTDYAELGPRPRARVRPWDEPQPPRWLQWVLLSEHGDWVSCRKPKHWINQWQSAVRAFSGPFAGTGAAVELTAMWFLALTSAFPTPSWSACGHVRLAGAAVHFLSLCYCCVRRPYRCFRDNVAKTIMLLLLVAALCAIAVPFYITAAEYDGLTEEELAAKPPPEPDTSVGSYMLLAATAIVLLQLLCRGAAELLLLVKGWRKQLQLNEWAEFDARVSAMQAGTEDPCVTLSELMSPGVCSAKDSDGPQNFSDPSSTIQESLLGSTMRVPQPALVHARPARLLRSSAGPVGAAAAVCTASLPPASERRHDSVSGGVHPSPSRDRRQGPGRQLREGKQRPQRASISRPGQAPMQSGGSPLRSILVPPMFSAMAESGATSQGSSTRLRSLILPSVRSSSPAAGSQYSPSGDDSLGRRQSSTFLRASQRQSPMRSILQARSVRHGSPGRVDQDSPPVSPMVRAASVAAAITQGVHRRTFITAVPKGSPGADNPHATV
eukprot:TRINITY_DN14763_c0_g1_i2.p1 TRINITY_DN14763_c0_g1~~TRINITY_DN14763_c0_g1_i2.p1  ORF type:complete len:1337 (+),score=145.99 TRINITY_DN14763_c0_g1_i2:146-4156(+)